jgi:hypothetical protein
MCTLQANSAHEALVKMSTLQLLAGAKQRRRQSARSWNATDPQLLTELA